jgi:NAD(P)H-quinone oxidoreductase subunit 6
MQVFFLGAALVATAGFYLLLNADFLAAAQILLYVGGINVLILFGIMLIDTESRVTRASTNKNYGWLFQTGLLGSFYLLLLQIIDTTLWVAPPFLPATSSVQTIGRHVFSDFLLPFELISVLLLIALLGVVVLARREQIS